MKALRIVLAALCLIVPAPVWAGPYLGDFPDDATVYCFWSSNGANGASITRSTNGTVQVYKDGDATSEVTTGVTDTEDFDSKTGIHLAKIVTTDSYYAVGSTFDIVLVGATIDSQTVNAHLCSFSIERTGGALALVKSVISGSSVVRSNIIQSSGSTGAHLEPTLVSGPAIVKDSTGVILTVPIKASTTGAPLTGLTSASSGLTAEYCRADGAGACTAITITGTCSLGTFTSGCFLEKDTTVGQYELHVPNGAFATGSDRGTVTLSGVSGMAPTIVNYDLVDVGLADLSTDVAAILDDTGTSGVVVASASKAPVGTYRKNTGSQRIHPFFMRDASSTQAGKTGLTIVLQVSKDGAAFGNVSGSVTEISSGWYYFTPSADDLNCDSCSYKATGSGAVAAGWYIFTVP